MDKNKGYMIKKYIKKLVKSVPHSIYRTFNTIEICKDNLLANYNHFKKQNKDFNVIPVLKANAYGHGLEKIGKILNDTDCPLIAVDGYFEAVKLLEVSRHRILVMGCIDESNFKLLNYRKVSFVIQSAEQLVHLGRLNKFINIHLELNTGMNRLGIEPEELSDYLKTLKRFPKINLEGVMTHLADADNHINSFTKDQVILFDRLVQTIINQGFDPRYIHIAQTAGSTKTISKFANSIRVGIGLYGINPLTTSDKFHKELEGLKPVLELKSEIIKVINIKAGDKVSYNGTFKAEKDMTIGVLPIGYYEGVPRELSNCGIVTSSDSDKQLPIIGRICMNHTMIGLDSSDLKVGDKVTIISNQKDQPNSVINICKQHKLFSYSLLTGISSSVRRNII